MALGKIRLTLSAIAVLSVVGGASAHSTKAATTPADGAILSEAPEVIAMSFDAPMRITMMRLTDETGTERGLRRVGGMAPATEVKARPAVLEPGSYKVEWRGLAADGHAMSGSFTFRIED